MQLDKTHRVKLLRGFGMSITIQDNQIILKIIEKMLDSIVLMIVN